MKLDRTTFNKYFRAVMIIKNIKDALQGKAKLGYLRSNYWPTIKSQHLKQNPICAVCGGKSKLEVHHKIPFFENQELELDLNNLITLCESKRFGICCHLFVGHAGNYNVTNKYIEEDIVYWKQKINTK